MYLHGSDAGHPRDQEWGNRRDHVVEEVSLRHCVYVRAMRASRPVAGIAAVLMLAAACSRDVPISTESSLKAGGTIAGIVRATEGSVPLVTRKVTVVNAKTGARFETTTGVNGGYTIKVPDEGRYRIEVELRAGEVVAKGPEETQINNGDLDPGRDFEITVKARSQ